MKHYLYVLTMIAFLFTVNTAAQTMKTGTASPVEFQQYTSYFEKNNDNLKGEKSFLVLANQPQFDKIFGSAATMGNNSFLPAEAFPSKMVVATIKRGSMRKYSDVKMTTANGKLIVSYTAQDDAPSSATFNSPLILAVDKGKYKEVVFMENGKKVGSAKI